MGSIYCQIPIYIVSLVLFLSFTIFDFLMRVDSIHVIRLFYGEVRDDTAAHCLTLIIFWFISAWFIIFIKVFALLIVVIEEGGVGSLLTQADCAKEREREYEEQTPESDDLDEEPGCAIFLHFFAKFTIFAEVTNMHNNISNEPIDSIWNQKVPNCCQVDANTHHCEHNGHSNPLNHMIDSQ